MARSSRLADDGFGEYEGGDALSYQLGVDIGGTFTDCVAVDGEGRVLHAKTPSTHSTSPVEGVVKGIALLAEEAGISPRELLGDATRLSHGTTIGTNLVVEHKGANVGLIATAGHGDALSMMRGSGRTAGAPIDQVFSVHHTRKPEPLVPPGQVVEVQERVSVAGKVLAPLDEAAVREQVRALVADGEVDAIAVALLWSFRNPIHEELLRRVLEEEAPGVYVSISSEISPRQGEYERTVATVINSYVGPASSRYLTELANAVGEGGLERPPFIMQANGGVAPVEVAQRIPLTTIGSGPAGGLAGTAAIAAACDHPNVIATDMGGTSFEVGLVVDSAPLLAPQEILEQYTFHMAHLDLRSIACGGGSIARIDPHSGGLRVGPESAGSSPGPACYGEGTQPTVTDADVVLGLIDAERFLGGRMKLDRAAAGAAIETVAKPLGLSVEEAAAGIIEVNSFSAATLIRQRTLEQGLDPRDFVLYAFGGAGPVHAFAFAEELGVREVVIPLGNGASTLSAYGIAASDVISTFEQECRISAPFDPAELGATVATVEKRALEAMEAAGFRRTEVQLQRTALLRYAEQLLQELPLDIPGEGPLDESACTGLARRFDAEYARLYGEGARAVFQAVEVFAIRITARVPLGFKVSAPSNGGPPESVEASSDSTREVYWPKERAWVTTAVHDGADLRPGSYVVGPAMVDLPHTGVSVAAGQRLHRDEIGNLVLTND
jgi:N-methylhydantoinase A